MGEWQNKYSYEKTQVDKFEKKEKFGGEHVFHILIKRDACILYLLF